MSSLHKVTCFECGSDNLQVIDEKNTVCLNCGIIQNKEEKSSKNDLRKINPKGSIKGPQLIPVTDSTEKRYSMAFRQIICICEKMNLQEDICASWIISKNL
jgi:transcription initiation factor TFIIIB Brf1 subunit/transcription initiation factor TFIIB